MNTQQQIWAFCHGQMNAAQREAFEARCREQPELMKKRREAEWIDHSLQNAYGVEAVDDEELTDRILREMQEDPNWRDVLAENAGSPRFKPLKSARMLRFVSLAAAAGIIALLGWWPRPGGELVFSEDLLAIAVRSDGASSEPIFTHCTRAEVDHFLASFRNSVKQRYRRLNRRPLLQQWLRQEDPRALQVVFQELRAGRIYLEVRADRENTSPLTWKRYYQSLDDCRREVEVLINKIAQELTSSNLES